jgi:hypothetical protein
MDYQDVFDEAFVKMNTDSYDVDWSYIKHNYELYCDHIAQLFHKFLFDGNIKFGRIMYEGDGESVFIAYPKEGSILFNKNSIWLPVDNAFCFYRSDIISNLASQFEISQDISIAIWDCILTNMELGFQILQGIKISDYCIMELQDGLKIQQNVLKG